METAPVNAQEEYIRELTAIGRPQKVGCLPVALARISLHVHTESPLPPAQVLWDSFCLSTPKNTPDPVFSEIPQTLIATQKLFRIDPVVCVASPQFPKIIEGCNNHRIPVTLAWGVNVTDDQAPALIIGETYSGNGHAVGFDGSVRSKNEVASLALIGARITFKSATSR